MNGLESYSVVLAALDRSAVRFGLGREPQKDSCKAAQGKCRFPWDGIGLAHKRQLRFHRAVCKTAISPERCIIAPSILSGLFIVFLLIKFSLVLINEPFDTVSDLLRVEGNFQDGVNLLIGVVIVVLTLLM